MSKKTIQHGSMAAIHMQSQPSILIGNDMILDSHKDFTKNSWLGLLFLLENNEKVIRKQ